MDVAGLRKRNQLFRQSSLPENDYKVTEILYQVLQLEDEDFIWELYRQLLHREPDQQGFNYFVNQVLKGTDKISIMGDIMQSPEAKILYSQNLNNPSGDNFQTFTKIVSKLLYFNDLDFIEAVYKEFLCRKPQKKEISLFLPIIKKLKKENHKVSFIINIMSSDEHKQLLTSYNLPIPTSQQLIVQDKNGENRDRIVEKNIGFFLGYSIKLRNFDGEGIGRFVLRLVEGLLDGEKNTRITIAVNKQNYSPIEEGFKKILLSFPNRLVIQEYDDIEVLNENTSVNVWIVPYVGMEAATDLKGPIILCLHDLVYMHFEEIYHKNQKFYDSFTVIVNQLVNKAKKIVFNSNYIRDNEGLKFLKLPKEKTEIIRLAAPTKEYSSIDLYEENVFRDKYKLYGDYIVYPTVIRPHKNCERLIEAFLKFKQTKEGALSNCCLIFTDHYLNCPQEKKIKELLNNPEYPYAQRDIIFLGRLTWNEVPLLYKFAVGTIIPTLFEGSCPFQILESLTMNTPVAISRIEVVKEVLPDTSAFITFDPYSIEEIEKAVYDLWKGNNIILEKQKMAIQHIFQREWSNVADEYNLLINEVIGSN